MPKHTKKRAFERQCLECGSAFITGASTKLHCSPECRIRDMAKKFAPGDECWPWPGSKNPQTGYGQLSAWQNNKRILLTAHRVSHRAFIGPIGEGMEVCHSCDNRPCFNPRHLFAGTQKDNIDDMIAKGRNNKSTFAIGTRHGLAKLSAANVLEIRASKETGRAVAKRFGISETNVSAIRCNRIWKHLLD